MCRNPLAEPGILGITGGAGRPRCSSIIFAPGAGVWTLSAAAVGALALTWLSGSTYGRTLPQIAPVLLALLVIAPAATIGHRALDLMAIDDDTPRPLGVRLCRARLGALTGGALLAATAVSAIGVVGCVALVGAPCFVRLLWRSRATAADRWRATVSGRRRAHPPRPPGPR